MGINHSALVQPRFLGCEQGHCGLPKRLRWAAPVVKRRAGILILPLEGLGSGGAGPLYRRVYTRIRSAILDGSLAPGQRLPSTRTLAADLGLSRITIEAALTQLRAEEFVVRRVGAGSFVAAGIQMTPQIGVARGHKPPRHDDHLSQRPGTPLRAR